ncbi:hypothetical protein H1R20_g8803, partial [Candolleomyces eurysporus]
MADETSSNLLEKLKRQGEELENLIQSSLDLEDEEFFGRITTPLETLMNEMKAGKLLNHRDEIMAAPVPLSGEAPAPRVSGPAPVPALSGNAPVPSLPSRQARVPSTSEPLSGLAQNPGGDAMDVDSDHEAAPPPVNLQTKLKRSAPKSKEFVEESEDEAPHPPTKKQKRYIGQQHQEGSGTPKWTIHKSGEPYLSQLAIAPHDFNKIPGNMKPPLSSQEQDRFDTWFKWIKTNYPEIPSPVRQLQVNSTPAVARIPWSVNTLPNGWVAAPTVCTNCLNYYPGKCIVPTGKGTRPSCMVCRLKKLNCVDGEPKTKKKNTGEGKKPENAPNAGQSTERQAPQKPEKSSKPAASERQTQQKPERSSKPGPLTRPTASGSKSQVEVVIPQAPAPVGANSGDHRLTNTVGRLEARMQQLEAKMDSMALGFANSSFVLANSQQMLAGSTEALAKALGTTLKESD